MREKLKEAAEQNGQSTNAEIVERLHRSLEDWTVSIPLDVKARASIYSTELRKSFELASVNALANLAEKYFPTRRHEAYNLLRALDEFLVRVPDFERLEVMSEFHALINRSIKSMPEREKDHVLQYFHDMLAEAERLKAGGDQNV